MYSSSSFFWELRAFSFSSKIWNYVPERILTLPARFDPRSLEDDEKVLTVLCSWRAEAKNKLLFVPRPERYDLFRRPERYLLGTSPTTAGQQWDQLARQTLLQDVFCEEEEEGEDASAGAGRVEIEGLLWMKSEGK